MSATSGPLSRLRGPSRLIIKHHPDNSQSALNSNFSKGSNENTVMLAKLKKTAAKIAALIILNKNCINIVIFILE